MKILLAVTAIIWFPIFIVFDLTRKFITLASMVFYSFMLTLTIMFTSRYNADELTDEEKSIITFKNLKLWHTKTENEWMEGNKYKQLANYKVAVTAGFAIVINSALRMAWYIIQAVLMIVCFPIIIVAILKDNKNIIDLETRTINDQFITWFKSNESEEENEEFEEIEFVQEKKVVAKKAPAKKATK